MIYSVYHDVLTFVTMSNPRNTLVYLFLLGINKNPPRIKMCYCLLISVLLPLNSVYNSVQ